MIILSFTVHITADKAQWKCELKLATLILVRVGGKGSYKFANL